MTRKRLELRFKEICDKYSLVCAENKELKRAVTLANRKTKRYYGVIERQNELIKLLKGL